MLMLPGDLSQQFNDLLIKQSFPDEAKSTYLKWLRFYWDFCDKYHYNPYCPESLPRFLQKLEEKRQSDQQLKNKLNQWQINGVNQWGQINGVRL